MSGEIRRTGIGADSTDVVPAAKLRWTLLPWEALKAVVRVRMFGCIKHDDKAGDSWRLVPLADHKESLMRHVIAYMNGECKDEETGEHNLSHAACRALFIVALEVGK